MRRDAGAGRRPGQTRQAAVATHSGKNLDVLRPVSDFSRVHQRRNQRGYISLGVPHWWTRFVRDFHCAMGGSKVSKLRAWAAQNALTLVFMSFMFIMTWVVILVATFWDVTHGK